ncbi:hypothetical protein IRB23SM22_23290 [Alkalibacterium sp. s-m-22]
MPFCILIDRATIVALKQHEKTKKLVITMILLGTVKFFMKTKN